MLLCLCDAFVCCLFGGTHASYRWLSSPSFCLRFVLLPVFFFLGGTQCTTSCGPGYQMRAVKCVVGPYGAVMDDTECNAATRPTETQVPTPSLVVPLCLYLSEVENLVGGGGTFFPSDGGFDSWGIRRQRMQAEVTHPALGILTHQP